MRRCHDRTHGFVVHATLFHVNTSCILCFTSMAYTSEVPQVYLKKTTHLDILCFTSTNDTSGSCCDQ